MLFYRNLFKDSDIPQPMVWQAMPFKANIIEATKIVTCISKPPTQIINTTTDQSDEQKAKRVKENHSDVNQSAVEMDNEKRPKKLSDYISMGDEFRIDMGVAFNNELVDNVVVKVTNSEDQQNVSQLGNIRVSTIIHCKLLIY